MKISMNGKNIATPVGVARHLSIDLAEAGIREEVRDAADFDDIRFYAMLLEYKLGVAESQGGNVDELDRLWAVFCSEWQTDRKA